MTEVLSQAGFPQSRVLVGSEKDEASLKKIVGLSYQLLPDAYRDAFVSAQLVDLDTKRGRALTAIHSAASAAFAAGAIPLPFSDALVITPVQVGLIASLAIIYGEPAEALKTAFAPLLLQEVGVLTVAGLSKWIPGLGSLIQAAVASALTEALGHLVHEYLVRRAKARHAGNVPPDFSFDWKRFIKIFNDVR
jgi:uncharacterized protein (DUF697 family)